MPSNNNSNLTNIKVISAVYLSLSNCYFFAPINSLCLFFWTTYKQGLMDINLYCGGLLDEGGEGGGGVGQHGPVQHAAD